MLQNEGRKKDFPHFYHNTLKQHPTAMDHLDVLAVHGYQDGVNASSGSDLAQYWTNHKNEFSAHANKRAWMTETSGYEDSWEASKDDPGAFGLAIDIATAILFGDASAWVHWQGSELDGIGRYNLMSGTTTGKKYQVSKHFYHFIRPGAVRVEATSPDDEVSVLGFEHTDHSTTTFVLINTKNDDTAVQLDLGDGAAEEFEMFVSSASINFASNGKVAIDGPFVIPARSIVTLHAGGSNLVK